MENSVNTIREKVNKEIRNFILKGRFKPGEKLLETAIAKELNVSRNPVREVFRQLEQEGILEYYPQKGCFLKEISSSELEQIFRLRASLEIISLEYCNFILKEDTLLKLEKILEKLNEIKKNKNFDEMFYLGIKFHELIVQECQKEIIYKTWKDFAGYNYSIFLNIHKADIESLKRDILTHKKLLTKLKTNKEKIIKKAIFEHYDLSKN